MSEEGLGRPFHDPGETGQEGDEEQARAAWRQPDPETAALRQGQARRLLGRRPMLKGLAAGAGALLASGGDLRAALAASSQTDVQWGKTTTTTTTGATTPTVEPTKSTTTTTTPTTTTTKTTTTPTTTTTKTTTTTTPTTTTTKTTTTTTPTTTTTKTTTTTTQDPSETTTTTPDPSETTTTTTASTTTTTTSSTTTASTGSTVCFLGNTMTVSRTDADILLDLRRPLRATRGACSGGPAGGVTLCLAGNTIRVRVVVALLLVDLPASVPDRVARRQEFWRRFFNIPAGFYASVGACGSDDDVDLPWDNLENVRDADFDE